MWQTYYFQQCFLDNIIHGDLILMDQGFDNFENLAVRGAALEIFPFAKEMPQLSWLGTETSQMLSNVRIYVKGAGGQIKCCKIL